MVSGCNHLVLYLSSLEIPVNVDISNMVNLDIFNNSKPLELTVRFDSSEDVIKSFTVRMARLDASIAKMFSSVMTFGSDEMYLITVEAQSPSFDTVLLSISPLSL